MAAEHNLKEKVILLINIKLQSNQSKHDYQNHQ